MSDKLDANVNNIDTSGFVSKTKYDTYKADLEKKITNISEFVKKKQITTSALTADENKIPDVSTLVKKKKKNEYNEKTSDIEKNVTDHSHDKHITSLEFNKLTTERFAATLKQARLWQFSSNKTNHVLVANELKKLQTFDSSYF